MRVDDVLLLLKEVHSQLHRPKCNGPTEFSNFRRFSHYFNNAESIMVKVSTADNAPEEIMVSCICLPLIPKSRKINQTI